jgi:hypothetical protein
LTHIVWDSFTHASSWSSWPFSVLNAPIVETSEGTLLSLISCTFSAL